MYPPRCLQDGVFGTDPVPPNAWHLFPWPPLGALVPTVRACPCNGLGGPASLGGGGQNPPFHFQVSFPSFPGTGIPFSLGFAVRGWVWGWLGFSRGRNAFSGLYGTVPGYPVGVRRHAGARAGERE